MFAGKFKEKMTNYYVVFVGRKQGVCDSWIECQRKVIFYKGGFYKSYISRDITMRSLVLYPPRWKTHNGYGDGISSPTPNCGHEAKKQMEK